MSLYVTTQSYRDDVPTTYGLLLELDETSGSILRTCRVDTPVDFPGKSKGRIKPGLRGVFLYKNKIYTATWNKIVVIDPVTFTVEREISHKWMSDLHGISISDDGMWVTSSLPDAAILYSHAGEPRCVCWMSESNLYENYTEVDKSLDWRMIGKHTRGFMEYHANHIEIVGDDIYITGRGQELYGRVVKIPRQTFLSKERIENSDIELVSDRLFGPHDGLQVEDLFWVTETGNASIAGIDADGKIAVRKKIRGSEDEKVQYEGLKDFVKTMIREKFMNRPGKKVTMWTRGLGVTKDAFWVGQSTWAGDATSRARIIKVNRSDYKIDACHYLDIPDYPETRIFQVYSSSS